MFFSFFLFLFYFSVCVFFLCFFVALWYFFFFLHSCQHNLSVKASENESESTGWKFDRSFLVNIALWCWQRGGFWKGVEIILGGSVTNQATPSSFLCPCLNFFIKIGSEPKGALNQSCLSFKKYCGLISSLLFEMNQEHRFLKSGFSFSMRNIVFKVY